MTRPRYDEHSTEFGLWLREQDCLDSRRCGYAATNIDYMWQHYKTGEWMLIEEKRYRSRPTWSQMRMFDVLDAACRNDPLYRGLHIIGFENTSPSDGRLWIDGQEATMEDLLRFLQFDW